MQSHRYRLSAAQMSEGFAAARAIPAMSNFLSGLPGASGVLPDELAAPDGGLDPAAQLVFETLARPAYSMRFLGYAEGSFAGLETRLASQDGHRWIAFARPGPDCWDLMPIGGRAQALALADEVLGVSFLPDPAMDLVADLQKSELVYLLAYAQKARRESLRARLEGYEDADDSLHGPADIAVLEAIIAREWNTPDPGSPLSRFAMAAGGTGLLEVGGAAGLRQGLDRLIDLGLARSDGGCTAEGAALAALLASRTALTVIQAAHRAGDAAVVEKIVLLHGPGSVLMGAWRRDESGGAPLLSLRSLRPGDVLTLLDRLLGQAGPRDDASAPEGEALTASEADICGSCGTLHDASSRFCRECGVVLADAK